MSEKACVDSPAEKIDLTTCDFCGTEFDANRVDYWTHEHDVPLAKIVPEGTPVPASSAKVTLVPCPKCHKLISERLDDVLINAYLTKEFKEAA